MLLPLPPTEHVLVLRYFYSHIEIRLVDQLDQWKSPHLKNFLNDNRKANWKHDWRRSQVFVMTAISSRGFWFPSGREERWMKSNRGPSWWMEAETEKRQISSDGWSRRRARGRRNSEGWRGFSQEESIDVKLPKGKCETHSNVNDQTWWVAADEWMNDQLFFLQTLTPNNQSNT